jgi:hypothetical protein
MAFGRFRHISVVAALSASAECQMPRETVDVLFVGNSHIYFNNLPEMIEGISIELEGPIVRGAAHTHGGHSLKIIQVQG